VKQPKNPDIQKLNATGRNPAEILVNQTIATANPGAKIRPLPSFSLDRIITFFVFNGSTFFIYEKTSEWKTTALKRDCESGKYGKIRL
jgi:hypothetical protein